MSMDWRELRSELPADVKARLDVKRGQRLLGKALTKARTSMSLTQQDVAAGAAMTQNTVSKIEHSGDVLISSVVRYMHSMGGEVELVLKTPDGKSHRVAFDPQHYTKQPDNG